MLIKISEDAKETACRCLVPRLVLWESQTSGIPGTVIRPEHVIVTTGIKKDCEPFPDPKVRK